MDTGSLSSEGQLVNFKAVRDMADIAPGTSLEVRFRYGEIGLPPCLIEADNRAASAPSS